MRNPILPTQIGGHEGVGVVVKLGPGADQYKVKTGDRVGIKWVSRICSTCRKAFFLSFFFIFIFFTKQKHK